MMMIYSYSIMTLAKSQPMRARTIYFVLHGDTQRWAGDAGPDTRTVGLLKKEEKEKMAKLLLVQ